MPPLRVQRGLHWQVSYIQTCSREIPEPGTAVVLIPTRPSMLFLSSFPVACVPNHCVFFLPESSLGPLGSVEYVYSSALFISFILALPPSLP